MKMEQLYEQHKGLLLTLAYQMTGTWTDAEDAVQDVFLKLHRTKPKDLLAHPKAYLCKMVINHCRDVYRSARKRREQYVGQWLPEPLPTEENDPLAHVVRDERLGYAVLAMLEKLSVSERTLFVLREAWGYDYAAIAELMDKSEASCRQLYSRAKRKMSGSTEPDNSRLSQQQIWIQQFIAALEQDLTDQVIAMLAEDVVVFSDGGGQSSAAIHPIRTRPTVLAYLVGISRKLLHAPVAPQHAVRMINGQPALVIMLAGKVDTLVLFDFRGERLQQLFIMRNPHKLTLFNAQINDIDSQYQLY